MGKLYPELDERLRKFIARQSVYFVATAPCLSTAGDGGHVNVSPKGYRDTFAVLGPRTVAYLDLTGSGAETIAHLRQNGQITIMFCSFDRTAKVLRLYGTGAVVLPGDLRWDELAAHFPRTAGSSPDWVNPDGAKPEAAEPDGPEPNGADHFRTEPNGAGHNRAEPNGAGHNRAEPDGASPAGGSERSIIVVRLDRIADSCGYAVPMMELKQERDVLDQWAAKMSPAELADYRSATNAISIDGLPAL
jgi:hypothetical protein